MTHREKLSEWIYNHSKALTIVALLVYAAAASGLYFAEFKSDFRSAFNEDSEIIKNYDKINEQYEKGETLAFYLKFSSSGEISEQNLKAIEYADDLVNTLPFVRSVRSLSSYQKPFSDDDSIVAKYVGEWARESNGLKEVNQYIAQQPQLLGTLIANDYSGAMVLAQLDLVEPFNQSTSKLMEAAEQAAGKIKQAHPGIEVHLSGTAALDMALQTEFLNFLMIGSPAIIIGVSLVVAWLSSSISITMAGLTTSGLALVTAAGIFGWLPVYFDQAAIMGALLVMLLTVLDCIHIGATYRVCISKSFSKEAAIKESIRANLTPVFYTTLTTGVGLITMLFSGSPPYILFAQIALVGIFAGFIYSFIFMTSMSIWLPAPKDVKMPAQPVVDFARKISFERPKQVISIFAIIVIATLALIPLNTIDEDPARILKSGEKFDKAIETIRADLKGSNQLLIDLASTDDQSITSIDTIRAIDKFESWLDLDPFVVNTLTINDIAKETKSTWDNLPLSSRLPRSSQEYEQLLLVYEMSLQTGQSASELIAADRTSTLMTVFMEDQTNNEIVDKKVRIEQWWAEQGLDLRVSISGRDLIAAQLAEQTVHKSILNGGIAAILITLFMIFSFQSMRWGLFSLIPNTLPFVLLFGVWALFSGEISQASCMAFTMVIGVVVDDSIHFISKFREAKRSMLLDDALNKTFDFVGQAITVGTIAFIVDGLLIYLASGSIPMATMGAFILLTFIMAWLCDMLLMPAILVLYYQRKEEQLSLEPVEIKQAA